MTEADRLELQSLRDELGGRAGFSEPVQPPGFGDYVERGLKQIANIPGKIINAGSEIADYFLEKADPSYAPPANDAQAFHVAPARNWQEQGLDIGGTLAAEIPMFVAGGGAVRKGLSLLPKMGRVATGVATAAGDAGVGFLSGARQGTEEAATQAAEFGALGAASAFTGRFRPLLRAATQSGVGLGVAAAGNAVRGVDQTSGQGLTNTALLTALPWATEALRSGPRALLRRNPAAVTEPASPGARVVSSVAQEDGTHLITALDDADQPQTFRHSEPMPVTEGPASRPAASTDAPPAVSGDWEDAIIQRMPRPEQPPPRALFNKAEPSQAEALVMQYADNPAFQTPQGPDWVRIRAAVRNIGERSRDATHQSLWREAQEIASNPEMISQIEGRAALPQMATQRGKGLPWKIPTEAEVINPEEINRGMKPLLRRNEAGATNPMTVAAIAGPGVGALVGAANDRENPGAGALRGALIGGGFVAGAKGASLLRRIPKVETFLRRNAKLGQDPKMGAIMEQARGTVDTLVSDLDSAVNAGTRELRGLTPAQRAAGDAYLGSDRSAAAEVLLSAVPPKAKEAYRTMSRVKSELQRIFAAGEGDPEKIRLINDTLGQWQTTQYRAFMDPKWKGDKNLLGRIVDERMGGAIVPNSERRSLLKDTEKWASDINEGASGLHAGGNSKIAQNLYTSRKDLVPSQRQYLGEYTQPLERELMSVNKLRKNAVAAKVIGDLVKLPDSRGRPYALADDEWQRRVTAAEATGDTATLRELDDMVRSGNAQGLGKLAGDGHGKPMMVQRQVADAIEAQKWDNEFIKVMGRINAPIKAAFTLYNPGTWARNYGQAAFQGISAGIDPVSLRVKYRRLYKNPKQLRWAKEDGILDAHAGVGEFNRSASAIESLLSPDTLAGKAKRVLGKIHSKVKQGYGLPDSRVRAATYEKFLNERLKTGSPEAAARLYAVEMTNRYTHNYSNVSNVVSGSRNIPLVNPFLTYTAEMGRIIKNLAEDVVTNANGRRIPSGIALVSLFGLGALAKAGAEAALSPEEKEAFREVERLLPDYMRSSTIVPWRAKGGKVDYDNITPWLPADDIGQFAQNILSGDFKAALVRNPVAGIDRSPLLNIASEMLTGQDRITKEQRVGSDVVVKPLMRNVLPPLFPGNSGYEKITRGFTRNESGGRGVTDAAGRLTTPGDAIGSLLGRSSGTLDARRLLKSAEADIDRELDAPRRKLKQILGSNRTQEVKDEAIREHEELRRDVQRRKQLLRRR